MTLAKTHGSRSPYFAMAEAGFESYSVTAVFRDSLFEKVGPVQAGGGEGGLQWHTTVLQIDTI